MKLIFCKILFCFLCFLTANIHILVTIHFNFLRNILKQTRNSSNSNSKLHPQWKARKSSYQVRQILAFFSDLIALILGDKHVKGSRVRKIVKEINFEGVLEELESKKMFPDTITYKICENNSSIHVK